MKLKEFVESHKGAALFFPNGVPQSVKPPGWTVGERKSEMCICQEGFFLKHADAIWDIQLEEVNEYLDCISFMGSYEALPWIGIWICGTIYAEDVTKNNYLVGHHAECALTRILQDGICEFSLQAVEYFRDRFVDEPRFAEDFYSALEIFRQKKLENQVP